MGTRFTDVLGGAHGDLDASGASQAMDPAGSRAAAPPPVGSLPVSDIMGSAYGDGVVKRECGDRRGSRRADHVPGLGGVMSRRPALAGITGGRRW